MTAADRRLEIISILVVSGHVTAGELAQEFGVTRCTILNDVSVLTYGYPIYTKEDTEKVVEYKILPLYLVYISNIAYNISWHLFV